MKRRQRRWHLVAWIVLALVLLATIAGALVVKSQLRAAALSASAGAR